MATFDAVFVPTGEDATGTVTTASSSTEIVIGPNRIFAFTATDDCHLKFGPAGLGVASASNFKLPGGTIARYDTDKQATSVRIFNPTGGTITYYIQFLAR